MNKLANYFDYAAATPLLPEVLAAMQPYLTGNFYNPSALYLTAKADRQALEEARRVIAGGMGARPTEIIFTAGGTEANNLAIRGVLELNPGTKVLTSAIEHESVLAPAKLFDCQLLPVSEKGIVKLDNLKLKLADDISLVSIMYANNEIGAIQPLREIAQIIKAVNSDRQARGVPLPLLLHTDACQAVNYLDMQVNKLGADLITINAGKIYGPKQCGALYVRGGVKLQPQILGGGQEFGLRSGSQNLANIVGFATAWVTVRRDYRSEARRLQMLRDKFITDLAAKIPQVTVNGPLNHDHLANNVSLSLMGQDNERLLMALDELGYMVATGSACAAASDEPSHVLRAMGLSAGQARSTLRITLGRYTTADSLNGLLAALVKVVAKQ